MLLRLTHVCIIRTQEDDISTDTERRAGLSVIAEPLVEEEIVNFSYVHVQ